MRQRQVPRAHFPGELFGQRPRARRGIDQNRGNAGRPQLPCGTHRVFLGARTPLRAIARNVGATIGQQYDRWRLSLAANQIRQRERRIETCRERCAAR